MQFVRRFVLLAFASGLSILAAERPSPFAGRWDLTIFIPNGSYPSWMEFADEGGGAAIRVVGRTGSVHSVRNAKAEGDRLTFDDGLDNGASSSAMHKLTGQTPDGSIERRPGAGAEPQSAHCLGAPGPLFDGHDLTGWEPDNPARNHWRAENGELQNLAAGANLRSRRKFEDFKLHIEYNCPRGGNSGVYLRGRYEVQVEYEPAGQERCFPCHGIDLRIHSSRRRSHAAPRPMGRLRRNAGGPHSYSSSRWRPDNRQHPHPRDHGRRTG